MFRLIGRMVEIQNVRGPVACSLQFWDTIKKEWFTVALGLIWSHEVKE